MLNITSHWKIKIKTTTRHHFILTKVAIIKKTNNRNCMQGCGEIYTYYIAGGNVKWHNYFVEQFGVSLNC